MKRVYLVRCLLVASCVLGVALHGSLANSDDFSLVVQEDAMNHVLAVGGLSTPEGERVLMPKDPAHRYGGFWLARSDAPFTVSLWKDHAKIAIAEVRGEVRWDAEGRVTKGEHSILRLSWVYPSFVKSDEWHKVTSEVRDGLLHIVVDESTVYVVTRYSEEFSALVDTDGGEADADSK